MSGFDRQRLAAQLQAGAEQLAIQLSELQCQQLLDYIAELLRWNRAYNLTAVTDPAQMVVRHLLDSLAVYPLIDGESLLDVGSGAGLPGIVLAIMAPQRQHHLLDSNGKKTRFLFHVATELALQNVQQHHCRVEQHQPCNLYAQVISRAFSSLDAMLLGCERLLQPGGTIIAMKGRITEHELQGLAALKTTRPWQVSEIVPLAVPGLQAEERHAVVLTSPTDESGAAL